MLNVTIPGPLTYEQTCRFTTIALLTLSLASVAKVSRADDQDVFKLEAGVVRTEDNNLFRLPDAVDPFLLGAGGHQRSETITASHLGLTMDQSIGLQQFHLEGFETYYDYKNYSFLSGTTTNFLASWQLAITRALTGKLSTQRQSSPANFSYYQIYNKRDIVTLDSTDLNLDWSPTSTLHLTTDLAERKYIDSADNKQISSYDSKFMEFGLLYAFTSGGSIGVVNDRTLGTIPDQVLSPIYQLDTGFQQNEDKLTLNWPFTTRAQLNAQAGYLKRDYDHFSTRNYSGGTGTLSLNYGLLDTVYVVGPLASGYTELPLDFGILASVNRSYNPFVNDDESYFIDDKKTVQILYTPTPKINLKLRFDDNKDNYLGAITGNILTPRRSDIYKVYTLELDWNPAKSLALAAVLAREQRDSTAAVNTNGCLYGCSYKDNNVSFSLIYKY